jgi:hypothetical protein
MKIMRFSEAGCDADTVDYNNVENTRAGVAPNVSERNSLAGAPRTGSGSLGRIESLKEESPRVDELNEEIKSNNSLVDTPRLSEGSSPIDEEEFY